MRRTIKLMDNWIFTGLNGIKEKVTLPHTWNSRDGQDGGNNYARGACVYERMVIKPELTPGERVYLQFHGVNAAADVRLNGQHVCTHQGGYSTFRTDVTDMLAEENKLTVIVDNGINDHTYPQKADFTFYGGIYRDVELLIVSQAHFDLDNYGGPGLKYTAEVSGKNAEICVTTVPNRAALDARAEIAIRLVDEDGIVVAEGKGSKATLPVSDVHLWNGLTDPYLYTLTAQMILNGVVVDEVSCSCGVRTFRFDPKEGFFLNGRSYPLHGVSRHQDWKNLGNAIGKAEMEQDMELIREVGANTVRLAHYQHDQHFYDLCDKHGMIIWAEIPYISEHMPSGRENTVSQMKELVIQNMHHPCIVTWGISNEITISGRRHKKDMLDNHRQLQRLCRELDPTRPTTLACYAMCGPFNPISKITDLVGWNLYLGWYVPGLFLNDLWMWFYHLTHPNRCLCYSEYGAEGMPNLHSSRPRRGDHTEEYQAKYHEYMLKCFERNPYLWATYVWNMFDFAADARDQGGEPGMNHKGLVTFDRKVKKDSFYLYKAHWSDEPFVHICSSRYVDRKEPVTRVKIYSNQPEVSLYCDGKLVAAQKGSKVFEFRLPISGSHSLEAVAGECRDISVVRKVDYANPAYSLKAKNSTSSNWV